MSHSPSDESFLFWLLYNKLARQHSQETFERASSDIEGIITFAGLFSGVDTAFIAITLTTLTSERHNHVQALVNGFFIASISCNILAAFSAVIGKQWISHGFPPVSESMTARERALKHQRQLKKREEWRLLSILEFLPVILQFSISWFWIGVTLYLWTHNRGIAIITLLFASIGEVSYAVFIAISIPDPDSPFQNSVTSLLKIVCKYILGKKITSPSSKRAESRKKSNRTFVSQPLEDEDDETTSSCITWSLANIVDERITLEAARLLSPGRKCPVLDRTKMD